MFSYNVHPLLLLFCQIGLRGGEWKRVMLEEHYHEAPDVSYADVTAKDFDVVLDDAVIKSVLDLDEPIEPFDVKDFSVFKLVVVVFLQSPVLHLHLSHQIFSQLTRLRTQDWKHQHLLTSLNLTTGKLDVRSGILLRHFFEPYISMYMY